MVIPAPNTDRPITTVSSPLSRVVDSAVVMPAARLDAIQLTSTSVDA